MLNGNQIKVLRQVADGRRSFGPEGSTGDESELDALKGFQPEAEEIVELGENDYLEKVSPHRESTTAYSFIDLVMVKGITVKGRRAVDEARGRERLAALKKIYDRVGDRTTDGITLEEFITLTNFKHDEARAVLSYLNDKGYLGGSRDAGLSHAGVVEAERIITDKEEAVRILGAWSNEDELLVRDREALRYRVLRRLYDMSSGNVDRGVPYYKLQEAEGLDERQWWPVFDYLKAEGLIRERTHIEITERGIDEIERSQRYPQSPTEHFSPVVIQHYYGNVGAVQSGSNSTAVVTQHQNSNAELFRLVEQLGQAVGAVPERPGREEALEQLEMLKEEARLEHPRPKRVKSYLAAIMLFTGDASIADLTDLVAESIRQSSEGRE